MKDQIILIDKPLQWTSFDVVKKVRKPLLEIRRLDFPENERSKIKNYKVGHAGTLDPLATGLLILCTGSLTTQIIEIQSSEKEYTGTIVIGGTTESYDLEKPVVNMKPYSHVTEEVIRKAVTTLTGEIEQFPPAHSAVKIGGKRAYELARAGVEVKTNPKKVIIYEFEITDMNLPEISFRIVCSKGTYIRTIAHDLGTILGTGGYLSALRRTKIGNFSIKNALSPEAFLLQLCEL